MSSKSRRPIRSTRTTRPPSPIGTDVNLFGHLLLRLEYRYDRSTNPAGFFYRGPAIHDADPGLGREQHAVYLMATGIFEHWFGRRDRP